ncbi:hypothetical protein K488DRAFT_68624 [Vararia minispora EC-137]|uniref:Uncharacterized protein n=1 Tax=Vararia minispora EC-137 TaxID=1314806 RepID=A0ACB8QTH2_9AGAM|nr:hypothetical protein K488DRAFT_68624 [Vararia minispora EC-137]
MQAPKVEISSVYWSSNEQYKEMSTSKASGCQTGVSKFYSLIRFGTQNFHDDGVPRNAAARNSHLDRHYQSRPPTRLCRQAPSGLFLHSGPFLAARATQVEYSWDPTSRCYPLPADFFECDVDPAVHHRGLLIKSIVYDGESTRNYPSSSDDDEGELGTDTSSPFNIMNLGVSQSPHTSFRVGICLRA